MAEEKNLQTVEKEEVQTNGNGNGAERTYARRAYVPRADIYETADDIFVVTDMPGVDQDSLDIILEKNILSLRGSVNVDNPENFDLSYAEYGTGDYERRFSLSTHIDQSKIEAVLKDGVLRLRLPKSEQAKSRKITVNAG